MKDIIIPLFSILGSFVVVYLTAIKEKFHQKRLVCREQLDNFYVPFYQYYCRGCMNHIKLSELDLKGRGKFLDLLSNNIYYMEPESQCLYFDFYLAFLNMLEAQDGNPDYPLAQCSSEIDAIFDKLSNVIFKEYRRILKRCYLPVPPLPKQ